MLHLEALESRCLLSNNGGLFVVAAAATSEIIVTDSIGDSADGTTTDLKMDFGSLSAGDSQSESVSVYNNSGSALTVTMRQSGDYDAFVVTGYSFDGNTTYSFDPESKADITIPAGKSVQVNVEYSPQTKGLDEESYIRFSTANDVKIVEMTGESTVLTTLDLVSASVENAFSSDKLEYDVLGSEYGIDVSLTLKNTLGREISSDNLDINFSLLDASGNVVASGLDFYNTITIAGVETHVATDHLPAIEYDAVENGKYDVSLFVDIPASVTAGIYTLTASIDTDTDVMNHSLNADLGEYLIFQGATLVLDSGVSYLDEDQTQVDTSTIVDREVDFGVVPVQQSSDVETVTITNVSGETITVTGMTIDGDNFSFAYDQEYAYPAGYSDLRSVQIDRYEYFYGFSSDDANWMTLNVTEQCELTLDGFNVQSIDGLKVYDQYGHEFFSIDRYDTTYWDGIIIIPNAGTYYVELVGLEGDVNFAFLKRDVETNNQVLTVATNESDANKNTLNEFTQTDDYNLYNVTVKEATSFSLNVSADLTDNIIRLYDFYGIDINSYSDFYDDAYVLYQSGYYNDYQKYLPTVTLDIYDNTGINVYSYSYDYADIMTDYLAAVVAGDLTESEADAFFDQYVEKFDLFEAGTYSFVYTYSTLNDVDHEYYDYQVANLNFNFKAEGSAFKLDNGESMTIPLVFMPSHAVEYNGNDSSLTIVTTADNFEIELSGVGVVGDLAFDEAYLTGDYVNFGSYTYNDFDANGISTDSMTFSYTAIESGTTTRMTMSIVNNGAGYVNSDAEVYFSLFDAEGTEYKLLLADGTDHLDLISYLKAEYDNRDVFMVDDAFDITVDLVIPATLAETNPYDFDSATMTLSEIQESLNFYTLVATIVQDDANLDSDAETDTAVFDNIYISSSDILVVGGHYQEDDGSIYLRENIIPVNTGGYTSGIDYAWDMDLIQTTIGEPQICYIDIFNRSDDDINITSVSIAALNGSDISDLFFVSLSDDYIQALPKSVTVEPGTVQRVYVFFDPQEYGDSADIGALVTIGTDIDQNGTTDESYCVTINPVVQGGDLRVLETSGATNDDNITIANTRVNEGASSITITLANSGDSDIIISEFDFGENSPFYVNYGEGDFTRYYKLKALSDGVPGTVEVTIYFDPETVGSYDQDFVIRSTDPAGGYQYTMHIQANGVNPAVDVVEDSGTANDNSLTFGNQAPDRAYEPVEKFTLNNYNVDPDTQENLLSDGMVVTGYSVGVNNADAGTFVVGIRTAEGDLIPISEFLADLLTSPLAHHGTLKLISLLQN